MLRVPQRSLGFLISVSKHQFSHCTFSLGTFRSSKQIHGEDGHILQTSNLYQRSDMGRRISTSDTMSTKQDDEVKVRPARHEDCHFIKAIDRDIHDGCDPFLYCFHHNVSTDNRFTRVAEISNQIVGYLSGHVIDDGTTIVLQEGRVTENHRGKALIAKNMYALLTDAVVKFPDLQKVVFAAVEGRVVQQRMSRAQPLRNWTAPIEVFPVHSDELKTLCESEIFSGQETKFKVDAIKGFPKREALKLLTEEICLLDFAPPRPIFGRQPSGWHTSTLGNQLQITDLFISRCPVTSNIQSFSFLTTGRSDFGIRTCVELYCDPKVCSEAVTIAHLLHFIREMASLHSDTKIISCFLYPPEVSEACVKDVLNMQLGISRLGDTRFTYTLLEYSLADVM